MNFRVTLALAVLVAGAAALTGCTGPNASMADLDRTANEIVDLAEATLPEIADSLNATLTEAYVFPERAGGAEGTTPRVWVRVHGTMVGPEPTRAEFERALVDAGFTLSPADEQSSDGRGARAVTLDGATEISLSYFAPGGSDPGIQFYMTSVKALGVSNGTFEAFSRDFARDFDQSLVHEAPALAALRQQADSMLDDAEAALPAIATEIGANITSARFTMWDSNADNAQASVAFFIEGSMTCPSLTQEALEHALVASGYSNIEPDDDARPHNFTSARAISADGTRQIAIYYALPGGPKDVVEINVSNVTDFDMSDSSWKTFKPTFTRDFDHSLVDSPST